MTDTKKDLSADLERVQTELDAAATEIEQLRAALAEANALLATIGLLREKTFEPGQIDIIWDCVTKARTALQPQK